MAKRQQTPEDLDEMNTDMDEEETEARGRMSNEGAHENLDDEDTDSGTARPKSTPSKKK